MSVNQELAKLLKKILIIKKQKNNLILRLYIKNKPKDFKIVYIIRNLNH